MDTAERFNIYTQIHKGLRAFMSEVLVAVGRADPNDLSEVDSTLESVRALLAFAQVHLEHEEHFIHPALEARRPGSSADTHNDHAGHLQAFEALHAAVRAVEWNPPSQRAQALLRLYRQLALFVAENFEHMHVEETQNHAVLTSCYSEDEMLALNQRLVAAVKPADMATALRWMVPASHAGERAAQLCRMQRAAPRLVFAGVLGIIAPHLNDRDRAKLNAALAADRALANSPATAVVAAAA
jgi:hypothetical protein